MDNRENDARYKDICEKLGFIPCELDYSNLEPEEDDTHVNPFSVLTVEECWYLLDNGYTDKPK